MPEQTSNVSFFSVHFFEQVYVATLAIMYKLQTYIFTFEHGSCLLNKIYTSLFNLRISTFPFENILQILFDLS